MLGVVGLADAGGRRAGKFSLGMGQRLGIAAALLGDPGVLLLDEPVNGLDPEGIRWIRDLLRSLAAEGRTVFVSSHLIGEMALTADRLVVIGQGRLLADTTVAELSARAASLEDAFFGLTSGSTEYRGALDTKGSDRMTTSVATGGRYRLRAGGPDGVDQAAQPALDLVGAGRHRRRRDRHRGRRRRQHPGRAPPT